MNMPKPDFRRMILRLPESRQDYRAVATTAQLAGLLGVALVGKYVEDVSVLDMAGHANAREFRSGGWRPLSADQLARDVSDAAREAQRRFAEAVGRQPPTASFSIGKGSAAGAIASDAGTDDIIVIIEPKSPLEQATHQFSELVDAAFQTTSSILLVPSLAANRSGPVVVIAESADDPSIAAALTVATSANEPIILVPARPADRAFSSVIETVRASGVLATLAEPVLGGLDLRLPALARGRLLIMRRPAAEERRRLRALQAQMPLLLVARR